MVRWMRSARIKGGKFLEAVAWAKDIAAFAEKRYNVTVGVYVNIAGAVGTVRWIVDYESLAAFEAVQGRLLADPEYHQRVKTFPELFIEGSSEDVIMRAV